MATHSGVSCDACMISNFPGRRYKCLICVNYDLCGTCYDAEAESQNHKNNHPMQCILTETAAEFFYTGETSGRRCVASLTCPYCAQAGFTARTLMAHCIEKHSTPTTQSKTDQVVMCPICVTAPTHRSRSRFASLAEHIAAVHDDGSLGDERDPFASPFTAQPQRQGGEEEEDSDDEEADEDEEAALTLNEIEQQALAESEQRRQETARQRLVNASSLAAVVLNSHTNNSNTQRRPLSRQTAIRLARGSFRSHFNNFPYGSSSRGGGGGGGGNLFNPSSSSRTANDPSTTSSSQASSFYDPFGTSLGADPMLDYVSQLMTNQSASTTGQWSFMSPFSGQLPTSAGTNVVDYARLQQQLDGSESSTQLNSLRATLLNAKQKRTSQNQQQQQQPSSAQPMGAGNTAGQDLPTWQQHLSNIQRVMNLTNVFGDNFTLESNANQTPTINPSTRNVQQSQRESGPQSLLEKMLKCELTVNKEEASNPVRTQQQQQQDRLGLLRSILLSSMTIPNDDDKDESQSTFNKENQL